MAFAIVWTLLIGGIYFWGWWRTRRNPRRHGFVMINVSPPGEEPVWHDTVDNKRFSDSEWRRMHP